MSIKIKSNTLKVPAMDATDLNIAIEYLTSNKHTAAVCFDSRQVTPGDIFVAVCGVQVDGHIFIDQAIVRGAALIVAQQPVSTPDNVKLVIVDNTAAALGRLAQISYGQPSKHLKVLGVTGTNGKTTVTYLVRQMLHEAGIRSGLLGTVQYD
ncbi:MAG: hypothetical protein GY869_11595, partial [Planctomycetes bacterium]|nr:hypothetical protein [Planctomycetota bacterium]